LKTQLFAWSVMLVTLVSDASGTDFQAAFQQADGSILMLQSPESSENDEPPALLPSSNQPNVAFAVGDKWIIASLGSSDSAKQKIAILGEQDRTGNVLVTDEVTGLALIEVPNLDLHPLEISKEAAAPGTPVVIPHRDQDHSLVIETSNIASELVSQFPLLGLVQRISPVQSDAPLRGAPILDRTGRVVGICGLQGPAAIGVNVPTFAPFTPSTAVCFPPSVVHRMLEAAKNLPEDADDVPKRLVAGVMGLQLMGESQALVQQVLPDTPAADANIRVNDVVEAVNEIPCFSHRQVVAMVRSYRAGETVPVRLKREGETLDVVLQLQSADVHKGLAVFPSTPQADQELFFFKDGQLLKIPKIDPPKFRPDGAWKFLETPTPLVIPQPSLEALKIERSTLEESLRQLEKSRETQDQVMKKLKAEIDRLRREKRPSLPEIYNQRESIKDLRSELNEIIRDARRLLNSAEVEGKDLEDETSRE